MPPIRKGDGTPVEPKGVSQIRTGDGRILFDGPALPDSVVDNFEDADADPPGVYGDGETIDDFYRGATDDWNRTTSDVIEGGHAISQDSSTVDDNSAVWSQPGDGLNRYPESGDSVKFLINGAAVIPGVLFNVEDVTAPDAFGAFIRSGDNEMYIREYDIASDGSRNGQTIHATESVSLSSEWYWAEVSPQTESSQEITFSLFQVDEDLTRGSELN